MEFISKDFNISPVSYTDEIDLSKLQEISKNNFETHKAFLNKCLLSSNAQLRRLSIEVIKLHIKPDARLIGGTAIDIVIWHSDDGDVRVREKVLVTLTSWLENLKNSQFWSIQRINAAFFAGIDGLNNNLPSIRISALNLLMNLSLNWPNKVFPKLKNLQFSQKKMICCTFDLICESTYDQDINVRLTAIELIWRISPLIQEDILLLSIEKSKRINDLENVEIIRAQGCQGALIKCLEDDFKEVRIAALKAFTEISSRFKKFARMSQDVLIEMLADDVQKVRLESVKALDRVGSQILLESEQVSIIGSALCEGSGHMRRGLQKIFSKCHLALAPCILNVIDALLKNLKKYPQDKLSIWRCAALIGRNHPNFVEICLVSLLRLHPYFSFDHDHIPRQDPAYLTVIIMVINASTISPEIVRLMPHALEKTKLFLKEVVPHLIPDSNSCQPFDDSSPVPAKRKCLSIAPCLRNEDIFASCRKFVLRNSRVVRDSCEEFIQLLRSKGNCFQKLSDYHDDQLFKLILRDNSQFIQKIRSISSKSSYYHYLMLHQCFLFVWHLQGLILQRFHFKTIAWKHFIRAKNLLLKNIYLINCMDNTMVKSIKESLETCLNRFFAMESNLAISHLDSECIQMFSIVKGILPQTCQDLYDLEQFPIAQIEASFVQPFLEAISVTISPHVTSAVIKIRLNVENLHDIEYARKNIMLEIIRDDLADGNINKFYHSPNSKNFYKQVSNDDVNDTYEVDRPGIEINTLLEVSAAYLSNAVQIKVRPVIKYEKNQENNHLPIANALGKIEKREISLSTLQDQSHW